MITRVEHAYGSGEWPLFLCSRGGTWIKDNNADMKGRVWFVGHVMSRVYFSRYTDKKRGCYWP